MKSTRAPSLLLALVLQVMPVTRVILATPPVSGTSFAIVSTWIAGLAALFGSYDTVSGASTTITSAGTATGTNGAAFSYRITTGPDTANTFSAVPLPTGLACSTTTGRITGTPTQEGSFSVLLTASDSGKPSRTVTKTLALTIRAASNPNTPPGITSQPSSQSVVAGGTASFSVTATGSAPLRYQWRTNGIAMTGATNSTLTISGASPSQAGNYAVVVTNNSGSITSATAVLTVLIPPSFTAQPVSQTVTAGNTASFTVVAAGTAPLGYRWRKAGTFINGANSATLTLPSAGSGDAGNYTVVVTNSAGSITSSVAVLTVNAPPSITTQPVSQTATLGSSATLSVVAAGTGPLIYQWLLAGTNLVNATNADLLITTLATNHAGSYTVVITNSFGSVTSNPAILTIVPAPIAPIITAQPESVTVTVGSNATFSVTAEGDAPLQYQWRKDASNLPGATETTLNLAGVQLANAGGYSVVVSNSAGAVTSVVATLTVNQAPVPDVQVPTVKVVTPGAAFTRVVSSSLPLSGTAQDNQRVASVEVRVGRGAFASASGTTNWTTDLSLTPGTNLIQVCATDAAGNRSLTNTLTVFFAVMTPLSLSATGNGTVAALTNHQLLELGQSYSLQATPAPGNIFSNWLVGGQVATGPRLTFVMSSNLAVEAHFVPNPWSAQKGVYTGLFHPTNDPVHEQSGFFSLVTTDKGTYSGKLLLNGATYPFTGTVGLDLASDTQIGRRGTNSLQLHLQFESGSDHVAGSISDTLWTSELFGYRAAFNAKTNPATSFQGKYTLLLPGLDQSGVSPAGAGYASISVSSSGSVALKGGLADGTTAVAKGALAANGQLPVFLNLYGGKGSAFGWLTFANTETNDILGHLLWTKPPVALGTLHPAGFTNEILALGSRFATPAAGTPMAGFSNAVVILEGGNLSSPATNDVFLSSLNKITVSTNQTIRLALAVSPSSGLLIGRFVHPETLTPSLIKGVVLQKQDVAGGYFLGTSQGGRVYLGRPEDATKLVPQP